MGFDDVTMMMMMSQLGGLLVTSSDLLGCRHIWSLSEIISFCIFLNNIDRVKQCPLSASMQYNILGIIYKVENYH